jgi:3-oxoacyl-[acyl-carrier protein] reductase
MFDLTGRTALVTGATGGIGGAIARALHAHGATVAISGTRIEMLDGLAGQLGGCVHVVPCNLAAKEEVENLVPAAEAALDLTAAFRLARAAVRGMMRRRFGRIIAITSVVGVTGNAGQANYAAAKAGMIGMTKSLAQEVASRGVTVNAIAPGFIETAMTNALTDKQKDLILARVPAGRLGSPEDVAAAAVYLASNEGAYVTGQTLHVNGGMAMI